MMQAMTNEPGEDIAEVDVELAREMGRLTARLDALVAEDAFDRVDPAAARRLMAAMVKVYALRTEAGERELPLDAGDSDTNATDMMIAASAFLKAGNLEVFELGMWQSYTRFV